jgi:hypothetical protein
MHVAAGGPPLTSASGLGVGERLGDDGIGIPGLAPSTGQAGRGAQRNVQDLRFVAAIRAVGVVGAADRKDRRVREIVGNRRLKRRSQCRPVVVATIAATAGTVISGALQRPQTRTWPQK